jgi:uncharacterized protein (TIGR00255 family)
MAEARVISMTGFASLREAGSGYERVWDIRSVNGKGLDLRLRVPDWVEGLEAATRAAVGKAAQRGNVSLSLKLTRTDGAEGLRVSAAGLEAALTALASVEAAAMDRGLSLTSATVAEVLGLRGVTDQGGDETDTGAVLALLMGDLARLLSEFAGMRRAEGAELAGVLSAQLERIAALTAAAADAALARRPVAEAALRENLARVMAGAGEADPGRVAQELAMLTVKTDVTEEIDRLSAHVAAARALLANGGAVGRKFDFLTQEFMREANTLCSKAGSTDLTRIGLDLKTVIDQMREQVQNVE